MILEGDGIMWHKCVITWNHDEWGKILNFCNYFTVFLETISPKIFRDLVPSSLCRFYTGFYHLLGRNGFVSLLSQCVCAPMFVTCLMMFSWNIQVWNKMWNGHCVLLCPSFWTERPFGSMWFKLKIEIEKLQIKHKLQNLKRFKRVLIPCDIHDSVLVSKSGPVSVTTILARVHEQKSAANANVQKHFLNGHYLLLGISTLC